MLKSGADTGIGVTEQVHPPRTDGVQVTPAVEVLEPRSFATFDGNERQGFMIFHLRTGVP
jgi:hypothetical protein